MRLTKLLLVFLVIAFCVPAQAQSNPSQNDTPIVVPPHAPNQLVHRFDYARNPVPFLSNPELVNRLREMNAKHRREFLSTMAGNFPNTCFKLRKYVFEPKPKAKDDGMQPVGDEMQMVGETDCTYANKVWPKSADRLNPPPSQFGVQSTVLRQK